MRKNEILYEHPLAGTIDEEINESFASFDAIAQTWRVHPADEADYKGTIGYKDA